MKCTECGNGSADRVRIEYVEEAAETLPLCSACRDAFQNGDLVTDVTVMRPGEDR